MADQNAIERLESTNLAYSLTRLPASSADGFDYACEILGPSHRARRHVARAVAYALSDAVEGALSAYEVYCNFSQVADGCLRWVVQVVRGEFRNHLGCLVCFKNGAAECVLLEQDGTRGRSIVEPVGNLLFFKSDDILAISSGLTVFGQYPVDVRGILASTSKARGGEVDL